MIDHLQSVNIQFNRNFRNVEGLKLLKPTNKQILDTLVMERGGLGGVELRGDYEDSPPKGRRSKVRCPLLFPATVNPAEYVREKGVPEKFI